MLPGEVSNTCSIPFSRSISKSRFILVLGIFVTDPSNLVQTSAKLISIVGAKGNCAFLGRQRNHFPLPVETIPGSPVKFYASDFLSVRMAQAQMDLGRPVPLWERDLRFDKTSLRMGLDAKSHLTEKTGGTLNLNSPARQEPVPGRAGIQIETVAILTHHHQPQPSEKCGLIRCLEERPAANSKSRNPFGETIHIRVVADGEVVVKRSDRLGKLVTRQVRSESIH